MTNSIACGLISIGRVWGTHDTVCSEKEALDFLEGAYQLGIRFFDTASAYGLSEERLGKFRAKHPDIFVATKAGYVYDVSTREEHLDNSPEGLRKSIEHSLEKLGSIDLLQLHRGSVEVLQDAKVLQMLKGFQERIKYFGVSVKEVEAAKIAIESDLFTYIQFPYNINNTSMEEVFELVKGTDTQCLINRPLDEGKITNAQEAYAFIKQKNFNGYVLTGTRNVDHLKENLESYGN